MLTRPTLAPMIGTKEAAELLGVTPTRVVQLIYGGTLKATKLGRDWLMEEADVEACRSRRKPGRLPGTRQKT